MWPPCCFAWLRATLRCYGGFTYFECRVLHTAGFSRKVEAISFFFSLIALPLFPPPPLLQAVWCALVLLPGAFLGWKEGAFSLVLEYLTPPPSPPWCVWLLVNIAVHIQPGPCASSFYPPEWQEDRLAGLGSPCHHGQGLLPARGGHCARTARLRGLLGDTSPSFLPPCLSE